MKINTQKQKDAPKLTPEQFQDELKKTAQKVHDNAVRDLPILLNTQEAINSDPNNIYLLPQTIHNIAIALPQHSYKFLADLNKLYATAIEDGKPTQLSHNVWKSIKSSAAIIKRMLKLETEEDKKQVEIAKYKHNKLIEEVGEEKAGTFNEEKEREYFQHVECDISSPVKSFIFIQTTGIFTDEKYFNILRSMLDTAKTLIAKAVERMNTAIDNTNKVLS